MGYIRVKSEQGRVVFEFANEMWIFGVLTVVLLMATLGPQAYIQWRQLKREKEYEQIPHTRLCSMV
jgi:hypothetical protein